MTYLWEIHGGGPGLELMASQYQQLRQACHAQNKSFFAFTLIREPLSFAPSYFKMFHLNCPLPWCEQMQFKDATEQHLLQSVQLHPNQQCFLLKHLSSVAGMNPSFYEKCKVTREDCEHVYSVMKNTLDWVGTTEHLSSDTIPLLQHLVNSDKSGQQAAAVKNQKVSKKLSFEESLETATLERMSEATSFDQFIFDKVRSEYVLEHIFPGVQQN